MPKSNDHVGQEIYAKHLHGSSRKFLPNPVNGRQAILQRFYVRRLTELSIARFKWTNLPKSIDPRFLEMTLFYQALCVFYFDPRFDVFMALRATQSGALNVTENPTRFTVFGNNFPSYQMKARQCVPIWANDMRTPDLDIVLIYAQKFAELDRTIEINSKNARRSKVIVANEDQRLTMANVDRQLEEGQAAVFTTDTLELGDKVTAVDLGINPDHIEKLHILKVRLWNECMMHLGIDGANQDKKERLVSTEVDANGEQINLAKSVALKARQLACEQINAKYPGLNVSVDYDTQNAGAVGFNTEVGQ